MMMVPDLNLVPLAVFALIGFIASIIGSVWLIIWFARVISAGIKAVGA